MAEDEKPRVTLKTPMRVNERTDTLRMNANIIERLIARYLRDEGKMAPGRANDLATKIVIGIRTSMPAPTRPGLRDYRLIPSEPSYDEVQRIAPALKRLGVEADPREVWRLIYQQGEPVPDDITA